MAAELRKLAQTMCSIDLADSHWTQELPRLPVPDLWLTVSRYLASLKAVLAPTETLEEALATCNNEQREQCERKWRQYERTDQLIKQFMLNEGPELQRDLKEYANKCQNWATEYWLQDMYLSNALPLPVNSNPFFLFPRQHFASSLEMLGFATRVIQFSVEFKYRIDLQTLKQDFGSGHGKGKPLCMETYKNFFHSYRMPHEQMDRLLPQSRRSNHIVVASCNQFYILRLGQDPLENPYRKDASKQLNESSIFEQLLRIYRVSREHARRQLTADQRNRANPPQPKVGLFTSENRKVWARLHKKLSHCQQQQINQHSDSPVSPNVESLRQIEDCLFVMCLDSLAQHTPTQEKEPDEVQAANIILTGGGTHLFTANRWFDKFLQIIVGRNGICGINIEHSCSEGITVLRFLQEFLDFMAVNPIGPKENCAKPISSQQQQPTKFSFQPSLRPQAAGVDQRPQSPSITSPNYVEPKSPSDLLEESDKITPLMWVLDDELTEAVSLAERRVSKSIENFQLNIAHFNHFGRAFIKNQNLSPDAFIQLALQYTFFKLHGHLVSSYESASLRQFRLGRVDNIRANTCETHKWIQSMLAAKRRCQTTTSDEDSADFIAAEKDFIRAITKQVEILRYTIIGSGPDNHLLALRELAKIRYGPDELPQVFTDESYKEYLNFRLSTSQLPNESGITVGYGAVTPDGYGCSYNPCENRIVFCISTFADCPLTDPNLFGAKLEESLLEMRQLCLQRAMMLNKDNNVANLTPTLPRAQK